MGGRGECCVGARHREGNRIVICRGELRLDSESGLASFVMGGRELSVEAGDVPAQVRRRRPSEPGHQDVDDVEVLLSKDAFLRGRDARSRRRACSNRSPCCGSPSRRPSATDSSGSRCCAADRAGLGAHGPRVTYPTTRCPGTSPSRCDSSSTTSSTRSRCSSC